MTRLTDSKARTMGVDELLEMAGAETCVISKKGKPSFAIVPLHGHDWESLVVAQSPVFKAAIAKSKRSLKQGKGLSLSEVKKRYA